MWATDGTGTASGVDVVSGHADQDRPLGSYVALIGAFGALCAGGLTAAARADRLPDRVAASDVVLGAVATYKVSRLIAKDRVTSGLRAPFTRFQEDSGHGEVEEAARGSGMRRAIGELLICPNCMGQWVALAFTAGLLAAPRATRTVSAMFAVYAAADALQLLHSAGKSKAG